LFRAPFELACVAVRYDSNSLARGDGPEAHSLPSGRNLFAGVGGEPVAGISDRAEVV